MKITWIHILICFIAIQPIYTQTLWKKLDIVPLADKNTKKLNSLVHNAMPESKKECSITCNSEFLTRSVSYHPLQLETTYLAVANANIIPGNDILIYNVNQNTGDISNPKGFSLRNGLDINPQWVDFSPDGKFIAIAVMDGIEVRKFKATGANAPTLELLNHPTSLFPILSSKQDAAGVSSLVYSSDGKWLAAVQADQTVSVFAVNSATGVLFNRQELLTDSTKDYLSEENDAPYLAFSQDSRFLAVHSNNLIKVFTNPGIICPMCQTLINLSNNSYTTNN